MQVCVFVHVYMSGRICTRVFPLHWRQGFFGDIDPLLCEGGGQIQGGRKGASMFFQPVPQMSVRPVPQSATGSWQQALPAIPALTRHPEEEDLSLAQSSVPWVPRGGVGGDANMEPASSPRHREICLICHCLPAIFLVLGQKESKSHCFRQAHG